jgi:hypothetical protein
VSKTESRTTLTDEIRDPAFQKKRIGIMVCEDIAHERRVVGFKKIYIMVCEDTDHGIE